MPSKVEAEASKKLRNGTDIVVGGAKKRINPSSLPWLIIDWLYTQVMLKSKSTIGEWVSFWYIGSEIYYLYSLKVFTTPSRP